MTRTGSRVLRVIGCTAGIGGLLWMIWLPVLGDFHDFSLPLAVGWTGCIVAALGVWIEP
jgi:hypothetical protein